MLQVCEDKTESKHKNNWSFLSLYLIHSLSIALRRSFTKMTVFVSCSVMGSFHIFTFSCHPGPHPFIPSVCLAGVSSAQSAVGPSLPLWAAVSPLPPNWWRQWSKGATATQIQFECSKQQIKCFTNDRLFFVGAAGHCGLPPFQSRAELLGAGRLRWVPEQTKETQSSERAAGLRETSACGRAHLKAAEPAASCREHRVGHESSTRRCRFGRFVWQSGAAAAVGPPWSQRVCQQLL